MKPKVNNDYYNHLGDDWYDAESDPIAILRAEQKIKNPWVSERIDIEFNSTDISILDVGCGGGFLTNYLATKYSDVNGLDASESSLRVAREKDQTGKVNYILGDAYKLPFPDESMNVVCAMDFLEHVERPQDVISECARILKPGGIFFFHTFNRNLLSWLIVIKFMEWFVPNTPAHLHVLHLFIKPKELKEILFVNHLYTNELIGLAPCFNWSFVKSIFARRVLPGFTFKTGGTTLLGYIGHSKKK